CWLIRTQIHPQAHRSHAPSPPMDPLHTGQKLLLLVVATLLVVQHSTIAYGSGTSGSISMALPGCQDKCGNMSIPYPFGTGKGCFREPFNVTCNETGAYLASTEVRLLEISLTLGEVRVQNPHIDWQCNYTNGKNSSSGLNPLTLDSFHKVSDTKNKMTSIGCATLAMVMGRTKSKKQLEYPTANTCFSFCIDASSVDDVTECSGLGCCQAPVSGNVSAFITVSLPVPDLYNTTIQSFSPCSYSFVSEKDSFKFDRSYVNSTSFASTHTDGVPLVLDWVVGNGSCSEATKMGSQYACQAMNSECIDVSNGPGYRCNCSQGYEGNPYLQGGCQGTYIYVTESTCTLLYFSFIVYGMQYSVDSSRHSPHFIEMTDINECVPPNQSLYPCKGNCMNTEGSYNCLCPSGFRSDDPKSIPCVRADPNKTLKIILGISASIIFLMVCIFALRAEYQKKKLAKEKERFFHQNGGQILYHQIMSKQVDTLKIFTQEDLKKATNDFDESREVGKGGSWHCLQGHS
uniref:EGF-like domain-containing protein n=2 Tax=Aegilops tauschii subsp. strangulata TaxID=200361 RepID=A0A453QMK3_AEGTS